MLSKLKKEYEIYFNSGFGYERILYECGSPGLLRKGKKVLVAYFSRSGSTRAVAEFFRC